MDFDLFRSIWFLLTLVNSYFCENSPIITRTPQDYYPRNGPLELTCQADGDPSPDISWFSAHTKQKINSLTVNDGYAISIQIIRTGQLSRLILPDPETKQEYKFYCNASNSVGYAVSPDASTGLSYINSVFQSDPPSEKESYEGKTVQLSCKPPKGRPQPKVTWMKDDVFIESSERFIMSKQYDSDKYYYSILKIKNPTSQDSGSYRCLAENSFDSVKSTITNLKVISAENINSPSQDFKFTESKTAEVQCPVTISGLVKWTRVDRRPIDINRVIYDGKYIKFSNIQRSDSGGYICRVKSSSGKSVEAVINIVVQAPPSFIRTPNDKTVLEGDDVEFKCIASGYPTPNIYWELLGLTVLFPDDVSNPRFRINKEGSLRIESVQMEDTGKYTCNSHSPISSTYASARLTVKKRDLAGYIVISLPPQNQTLVEGSTATFRCDVSSHVDAVIKWYRGPQYELLEAGDRINLPTRGALQIKKIDPTSDTNVYTCEATLKKLGMKTRWTAFLRVVYPDSGIPLATPLNDESQLPLPPVLGNPINTTADSVTLTWSNSGQEKYWVEYVRFGSDDGWIIYTKDWPDTKITVKNLLPKSWYQFLVRAKNSKGLSRASVPTEYVKTLSRVSNRRPLKLDSKDRNQLMMFSQIQLKLLQVSPIFSGKIKIDLQISVPQQALMNYIDGFKIRYNMVSMTRCLDDFNQMRIHKDRYCSFHRRSDVDIRYWIAQSEWWPVYPQPNMKPNITSGIVDFRVQLSPETKIVQSILTGLNPFSCYELTAEAYSNDTSMTTNESPQVTSLMLENRPSRPPENIRTFWSKTGNSLAIHWDLPPKYTWNGFVFGFIVHIFANESRNLIATLKYNNTFNQVDIPNLDSKRSYSLHLSLFNCYGEGVRSPRIYVPPKTDTSSAYEHQPWFIPVIVVGTLIFWVLLCCLVVYLCCVRFQIISKSPKFKSKDPDLNLEPLMNSTAKDSNYRSKKTNGKSYENHKPISEALYSATSIVNTNQGSITSGTCTPYASASIIDSVDGNNEFGKFYTGSMIDELGPAPTTLLPPYLAYAPHYTAYSHPSAVPFPVPVHNSTSNSICFSQPDNAITTTGTQNSKYFSQSVIGNNWPNSVKMGVSQLPGSSSGTSSNGSVSQKKPIDPKSASLSAVNCSAGMSVATLGSTPPSATGIVTDSCGSGSFAAVNEAINPCDESPKSTIHYDVIPNRETGDEFCDYSSQASDSNKYEYDFEDEGQNIICDTATKDSVQGSLTQGQHSPDYSTDSVTYSAVPHRPYPKANRKKQMRHYQCTSNNSTHNNNSIFSHKSKL